MICLNFLSCLLPSPVFSIKFAMNRKAAKSWPQPEAPLQLPSALLLQPPLQAGLVVVLLLLLSLSFLVYVVVICRYVVHCSC